MLQTRGAFGVNKGFPIPMRGRNQREISFEQNEIQGNEFDRISPKEISLENSNS
jgi:hypothetical protein